MSLERLMRELPRNPTADRATGVAPGGICLGWLTLTLVQAMGKSSCPLRLLPRSVPAIGSRGRQTEGPLRQDDRFPQTSLDTQQCTARRPAVSREALPEDVPRKSSHDDATEYKFLQHNEWTIPRTAPAEPHRTDAGTRECPSTHGTP